MTVTDATFLAITDIHFDPFNGRRRPSTHHNAFVRQLVTTPVDGWPGILTGIADPTQPGSRQDSNYALMTAVLDEAKTQTAATPPDFIIYPGDFLRHDIWQWRGSTNIAASEFEPFVKKMAQLVLNEITHRFPGVPVFMTFGNDDSYASDYGLQENGTFLADLATDCQSALGSTVTAASFAGFTDTGCYSAVLPKLGHRLLSVSNVFWSDSWQNSHSNTPGDNVIAWLDAELTKAEQAGERVWMVMHIPPGEAGYLASGEMNKGANWRTHFARSYQDTIDAHDVPIDIVFTGHTHMDDYRFLGHKRGTATVPILHKIVPAVSPKFGQNPCFQIYSTRSGEVAEWTTHYLAGAAWLTYNSQADYRDVSPAALLKTFRKMVAYDTEASTYAFDFRVHQGALPQNHIDEFIRIVTAGAAAVPAAVMQVHHTSFDIEQAMAQSSDADLDLRQDTAAEISR